MRIIAAIMAQIIEDNKKQRRVYRSADTIAPPVHTRYPIGGTYTTREYTQKKAIFRSYQVIWYILGVIEVLLAFRVLLRLLGANPSNGFASFIYAITSPFAIPFAGLFRTPTFGLYTIEWSTLLGMIVYAIVAYGLIQLLQLIKPTNPEEVEEKVDNP